MNIQDILLNIKDILINIQDLLKDNTDRISVVVLCLSALAALWKYFYEKNKEINLKLLSELYAPLYSQLIKQEIYVAMHNGKNRSKREKNEAPLYSIHNKTQEWNSDTHQMEENREAYLNIDVGTILKKLDQINTGLAPKKFYSLLSMYQVIFTQEEKSVNYLKKKSNIEEIHDFDQFIDQVKENTATNETLKKEMDYWISYCKRVAELKIKIEAQIRTEIIKQYRYCERQIYGNRIINTFKTIISPLEKCLRKEETKDFIVESVDDFEFHDLCFGRDLTE